MTITITLAEPLMTLLERKTEHLHLSADEFATKLVRDALLDQESAQPETAIEDDFSTLEDVVASIKAMPPNPGAFHPSERANDKEYLDYLLANPPRDTMTFEEWERCWPAFEQELKMLDRVQDIAE